MVLILLTAATAVVAFEMMYANTNSMAYPQPVKNSPAVGIKLLYAAMAKNLLLEQLPDLIEGLLFHRYLPIIYPVEIQCHIVCAAANAGTPWWFLVYYDPAKF